MNIGNKEIQKLLGGILFAQEDPVNAEARLSDERMRAVLGDGRQSFSKAEQQDLLRSPVTRERFLFLKQLARAETLRVWKRQRVEPEPVYALAASADEVRQIDIDKGTWRVSLVPLDETGETWDIVVEISESMRRASPRGVRLTERETGEVWAAGMPDERGMFSAFWTFEESPPARLKQHTLVLEPR
ncbi:MAG: hypothetical protein GY862_35665 [Gammaproteobacteria bacterium]|nr:hypothetical protein [Gammaproteobacteria bacterium]